MIVGTSTSCSASCVARKTARHRDVIKQDLGHFDNLLWNRQKEVEEARNVMQLFTICVTGASRNCTIGA